MSSIEDFHAYLCEIGKAEGTADLYAYHVKYALDQGINNRLNDAKLAPLTRRACKAALQAYAHFLEDPDGGNDAEEATKLTRRLRKISLPPPQKTQSRPPLARSDWMAVREGIDEDEDLHEGMRAVLGMIAVRGFRVGDVLRLTRKDVRDAVRTGNLYFVAKGSRRLKYPVERFRKYLEALLEIKGWESAWEILAKTPKSARQAVSRNFKRLVENYTDLDPSEVYTHRFRHTYAAEYLKKAKGEMNKLKLHMGWADISVAAAYVDAENLDSLEDLAESL